MILNRNKKHLLHRFLASHLVIVLLVIFGDLHCKDIFVVWAVTVIFPNIALSLITNLDSMEIGGDNIKLVFYTWLFIKRIESYRYEDLIFTYKKEFEAKSYSTLFRIYKKGNEKSLISIGGLVDGWYDENVKEIIQELNKRGIEVKTK